MHLVPDFELQNKSLHHFLSKIIASKIIAMKIICSKTFVKNGFSLKYMDFNGEKCL